nr:MAG TPA: hypothetical protein [Caudoviricetes sp.]
MHILVPIITSIIGTPDRIFTYIFCSSKMNRYPV